MNVGTESSGEATQKKTNDKSGVSSYLKNKNLNAMNNSLYLLKK